MLRLFLNNFPRLFIPLKVIFGLFPFVDLTCTSYFTHLHPYIREEWYGIAGGISFRNNIVMALDSCPKCIFAHILRMNRQISIKFCICIDIYIYDLHLSNYIFLFFSLFFIRVHTCQLSEIFMGETALEARFLAIFCTT